MSNTVRFLLGLACVVLSSQVGAVTMQYRAYYPHKSGYAEASTPDSAMAAACDQWLSDTPNLNFCTPVGLDDPPHNWKGRYGFSSDDDRPVNEPFRGKACDGSFSPYEDEWAVNDDSCEAEQPNLCADKEGDQFDAYMDGYVGPSDSACVGDCAVTGSGGVTVDLGANNEDVLNSVEYTGAECEGGEPGVAEADEDCITDAAGNEACIETDDQACGSFNGERVCPEELPDESTCTFLDDGDYVCGTSGDDAPVPDQDDWPEDSDGNQQVPQLDATASIIGPNGTEATVGQGGFGDRESLGDSGDAESGGEGDGDGEFEGVCATDPAICSNLDDMSDGLGEANSELSDANQALDDANDSLDDLTDDSVPVSDQNEADGPLPDEVVEEIGLPGGPVYEDSGLGSGAACPDPETFDLSFLGAGTKQISYQPFCDFAAMIRPLVLAVFGGLSALLAFRKLA